ncbi:MAG: hypothetical protein AABX55_00900, partial [Nanoarchaeota archaeon]
KSKKGQVTLYIILGILVVLILAGVLLVNQYLIKSDFEREKEKITVASEFQPVKTYLDSCINSIATDGTNLLGLQAGYIDLPEDNLPINPLTPFSNKLDLFGNGALQIPYWYYETSNGIQKQQIPSLGDMEKQLSDYINFNINNCLNNFTAFEGYTFTNFENLKTEVTIQDEKIFVEVDADFEVTRKDLTTKFDKFLVSLDIPLGRLYNVALDLLEKENQDNFFEQKTIDMLVLYDEIPYSGESFSCSPRVWSLDKVKQDLKKIIKTNIEVFNPAANRNYLKFDTNTRNSNVNFKYEEDWPLFVEVDGGEQILKEEPVFGQNNPAAAFLSTIFCLNQHKFVYDIKYPILIILNDKDYYFQYALMAIIDNNQPRENKLGVESVGETNSIICNSANIKTNINVIDAKTSSNIEDANVKFSCVGTNCNLGETTSEGLTTNVPACVNAAIIAEKEGYLKNQFITDTRQQSTVLLQLKPLYKKEVEIKIIDGNEIRNPRNDEFVVFNLNNEQDNYQLFVNNEVNEINLLDGNYRVNSYIIKEFLKGIKLNKQSLEYCTDVPKSGLLGAIGIKERKCFTTELEETNLDKVLIGGAIFDLSLSEEELTKTSKITLYTIYNKVPNDLNELQIIYNNLAQNSQLDNFRYPKLK